MEKKKVIALCTIISHIKIQTFAISSNQIITFIFSAMNALSRTTYEYADVSSLHGILYIFNRKLWLIERLLWFIVWLGCVGYCLWSVMTLYQGWQDNLVLTTVRTTGNKHN